MEERGVEDVARAVMEAGEATSEDIGVELDPQDIQAMPCTGDGGDRDDTIYSVRGRFYFKSDDVVALAERLKEHWESQGWDIENYRTADNGDVVFDTEDPKTGWSYSADAIHDGGVVYVPINSTCYRDENLEKPFLNLRDLFPEIDWPAKSGEIEESPSPSESS